MDSWILSGIVAAALNVGLTIYLILIVREQRDGAKAALQAVQLQLAFISGRIGLRNQDLEAATMRKLSPEQESPPPEVIGGMQWNDFEELVDRMERGEVTAEDARRAG